LIKNSTANDAATELHNLVQQHASSRGQFLLIKGQTKDVANNNAV